MASLNELRSNALFRLSEAGVADAGTDALLLMEHVFNMSRDHILVHGLDEADVDKAAEYERLVLKRSEHLPLQYITGHQEFMGIDFAVNEHVLIPRQDTECLVEEAMIETNDGMRVLDLCTGSGCILISLMKYKNDIEGVGVDISGEALDIASLNAGNNGVEPVFLAGDLYDALKGIEDNERDRGFDVIISNPPYIRRDVIPTLMEEVRDHEPVLALDGGEDGLVFYRRIINGADKWLLPGGIILFETGYDQGAEVSGLLKDRGYRDVCIIKDLAGLDRVVKGRKRI